MTWQTASKPFAGGPKGFASVTSSRRDHSGFWTSGSPWMNAATDWWYWFLNLFRSDVIAAPRLSCSQSITPEGARAQPAQVFQSCCSAPRADRGRATHYERVTCFAHRAPGAGHCFARRALRLGAALLHAAMGEAEA